MPALRALIGAALLIALAATGYAHRAPDASLQRFLAAGGDLSSICDDATGSSHLGEHTHCDACRFVGAALLTDQRAASWPVTSAQTRSTSPSAHAFPPRFRDPATGPRAPPRA